MSICNLAYRRDVIQAAGGFREDLGRKGTTLLAGADQYLRHQMDDLGLKSIYHPGIVAKHFVPSSRITKGWLWSAAYWQGRSKAIWENASDTPLPIGQKLRFAVGEFSWALPRLGLMLVAASSAERFRRSFQITKSWGFISGLFSGKPGSMEKAANQGAKSVPAASGPAGNEKPGGPL